MMTIFIGERLEMKDLSFFFDYSLLKSELLNYLETHLCAFLKEKTYQDIL